MRRRSLGFCSLACLLVLLPGRTFAGSVLEPGAPLVGVDVAPPRAAAMGAHAAVATGNDALLVNPAGLAQVHRYHAELDGVLDPQFPGAGVIATIADSTSLAVATGLLFSRYGAGREAGRAAGYQLGLSYAYPLGSFALGGQTRYIHYAGPGGDVHRFAQDVGLLARRGAFSWALVGQNLGTRNVPLFPPMTTLGVAWGSDADSHLAFDYKADLGDTDHVKHKLAGGYEVLVEQAIALRAGYAYDLTQKLGWLSLGLGLLTEKGGLQLAYRRRVSGGFDHFFEAGITLYLE